MIKNNSNLQENNTIQELVYEIPDLEKLTQNISGEILLPGNNIYEQLSETGRFVDEYRVGSFPRTITIFAFT